MKKYETISRSTILLLFGFAAIVSCTNAFIHQRSTYISAPINIYECRGRPCSPTHIQVQVQRNFKNDFRGRQGQLNQSNQQREAETNKETEVKVGSQEYYAGFVSRNLDEAEDRVTGDKVLIPTLKFVGGFTVVIGALLIGFLASNGII
jgi:hypothetical protein